MGMAKGIATVSSAAIVSLGLCAGVASAYAITGGSYTGSATATHSFTVASAFTLTCPAAQTTFSGTATGSATTNFTPTYGGGATVCTFFGLPTAVSQSGTWSLTVTGGPDGSGWYTGNLHIPATTVTTISTPLAGCVVTVAGTQQFSHGTGGNVVRGRNVTPTGVELQASVEGISYSASGCPFSSGSDGVYSTNGVVSVPGITIS